MKPAQAGREIASLFRCEFSEYLSKMDDERLAARLTQLQSEAVGFIATALSRPPDERHVAEHERRQLEASVGALLGRHGEYVIQRALGYIDGALGFALRVLA